MAKERLSKLQKWILAKCFKDLRIYYQDAFEFFGKRYTKRKPDYYIGEGHDLKKMYGENYEKEIDIEKVERATRGGYVWKGLKISRKKEFCVTNSEKAVISRSLASLVKKGFLIHPRKWGEYRLTQEGFLKANKTPTPCSIISFKEYQEKIEKAEQERQEARKKSLADMIEAFRNMKAKR